MVRLRKCSENAVFNILNVKCAQISRSNFQHDEHTKEKQNKMFKSKESNRRRFRVRLLNLTLFFCHSNT